MDYLHVKEPGNLTEIQRRLLATYRVFSDFCRSHGLTFAAAGGTKIGAVLWQGFIPWDDDIDIVMPWRDYQRLGELMMKRSPRGHAWFDGVSARHSDQLVGKFHDERTMFTSYNLLPFPESFTGVFVDVFPVIGVPAEATERELFVQEILELRGRLDRKRLFDDGEESTRELVQQLYELMNRYDPEDTGWSANVANPHKECFLTQEQWDSEEMAFEDALIPVPREYDKQLKQQYTTYSKDWQWPKDQKICTHEDFALVDLRRSCRKYALAIAGHPLPGIFIKKYTSAMQRVVKNLGQTMFEVGDVRDAAQQKLDATLLARDTLEQELAAAKQANDTLQGKQQETQQRLSETVEHLKNVETRYNQMQESLSWKVTKPLRVFNKAADRSDNNKE